MTRASHEVGQALADATGLSQEELGVKVAAGALFLALAGALRLLDVLRSVLPAAPPH